MKGKKHQPEQIIKKLREADAMIAAGKTLGQVAQALEIGSDFGVPTLIQCAAGRDRTGIVVACILDLLEVPEEQIATEYALSDGQVDDGHRAHAETMIHFLQFVRIAHGSSRDLVMNNGATEATLQAASAALLE